VIQVRFDPDQLPPDKKAWWDDWQIRAEAATREVIDAWETWKSTAPTHFKFTYKWKRALWSELKDWLLANVFHDKCAYCETPKVRAQFHADHFRPKGRVKYRPGGQKRLKVGRCTDPGGQAIDHPGYFWLAYDWWNLFPACALCNTEDGKKDQFPVQAATYVLLHPVPPGTGPLKRLHHPSVQWSGFAYLHPDDLDVLEDRLLLHPYADDPRQHLAFGDEGTIWPRAGSELGKQSIEVFNLKDEALRKERQKAQEAAENNYWLARMAMRGADLATKSAAAEATLDAYHAGVEPYSAAVLDYMDLVRPAPGFP
jgi:hypothetical protein